MIAANLIATQRYHHHAWQVSDPTPQEHQQIQGGLIGPVDVLDHHDRRPCTEEVEELCEHDVLVLARREQIAEPVQTERAMSCSGPSARGVWKASQ